MKTAIMAIVIASLLVAVVAVAYPTLSQVVRNHNGSATQWDRMENLCRNNGGVRHAYTGPISLPGSCVKVKCGDGTNMAECER